MDNEASRDLKDALVKGHINYQLVPPHIHCANLAESAIRAFKNHFLAGLASVNPSFHLSEWGRFIPQVVTSSIFLRFVLTNPKLSAYSYLFGQCGCITSLVPPGTEVLAHYKLDNIRSWALYGEVGWTI